MMKQLTIAMKVPPIRRIKPNVDWPDARIKSVSAHEVTVWYKHKKGHEGVLLCDMPMAMMIIAHTSRC